MNSKPENDLASDNGGDRHLHVLLAEQAEEITWLRGENQRLARELAEIHASTSWKITDPLRQALIRSPRTAVLLRRTAKLIWWTLSFQLLERLRQRRRLRTPEQASEQAGTAFPDSTPGGEAEAARLDILEKAGAFNGGWYGARELEPARRYQKFGEVTQAMQNQADARYERATQSICQRYLLPQAGAVQAPAYAAVMPHDYIRARLACATPRPTSGPRQGSVCFSILTPFYRHREYFARCARSVAALMESDNKHHGGARIDWTVVNDDPAVSNSALQGAVPDSIRRAVSLLGDGQNRGIAARLNEAIKASRGEWVLFLDCDDIVEPDAVEVISHYAREFPDCRYISSGMIDIDEQDNVLRYRRHGAPPVGLSDAGMVAGHLKALRRDLFDDIGLFDLAFDGCQDYDLALRVAAQEPILLIPEYLYRYRWHADTQSVSKVARQDATADRIRETFLLRLLERDYPAQPASAAGRAGVPRRGACIVRTQGQRLDLLAEAIESAASQSVPVTPVVVVHGGTGALGEVQALCRSAFENAVCLHAAEAGRRRGYPANVGIEFVRSHSAEFDFVCFLDDDDILYPLFAERMAEALAFMQADLVYAQSNRREPWQAPCAGPGLMPPACLLAANFITTNSYCLRVDALNGTGARFNEQMEYLEDWDFLLSVFAGGARFAPLFETLSEFRIFGDGNVTVRKSPELYQDCVRMISARCERLARDLGLRCFYQSLFSFPFGSRTPLAGAEAGMLLDARRRFTPAIAGA